MNDNTDLPHQPDTLQQQPPLMKKKSNPIWIVVFILLLIVNVIFVSWARWQMSGYMGAMAALAIFPLALPLAIIDFLAVFFYIHTQHPQGMVKVLSYTAFILVSLVLAFVVWAVYTPIAQYHDFDLSLIIGNPLFIIAIFVVATSFLIVRYLRQKSRK